MTEGRCPQETHRSRHAADSAHRLGELFRVDRERIKALGRVSGSALRVHQELQSRPAAAIGRLASATKISVPTVIRALRRLDEIGIVREMTQRKRKRLYCYARYLDLLNEETMIR